MDIKRTTKCLANKIRKKYNNMWLFTSFNGDYSDNPKYLSEFIHEEYPGITIYWAIKKNNIKFIPHYVNYVEFNSYEHYKIMGKCGVIIDNSYGMNVAFLTGTCKDKLRKFVLWLYKSKNQKAYLLWHGTPLKCIGKDRKAENNYKNVACNDVTMFVGNKFTKDIMERILFKTFPVIDLGMTRNDILFTRSNIAIDKVKTELNLPKDKKIVLYAPTFRNDGDGLEDKNVRRSGIEQLESMNIDLLLTTLQKKFLGEWIIVLRFHYHVINMVNWKQIKEKWGGHIVNGNMDPDMSKYLICSDCLITDFSSSMFDFALTNKPCFLFTTDYDNYQQNERGLYLKIEDLPFSFSKDFSSLIQNINNFKEDIYIKQKDKFLKKINNKDNGDSCKQIAEYIIKDINYE